MYASDLAAPVIGTDFLMIQGGIAAVTATQTLRHEGEEGGISHAADRVGRAAARHSFLKKQKYSLPRADYRNLRFALVGQISLRARKSGMTLLRIVIPLYVFI